jgi:DNA-binding HxlR family transcriptional regulator
LTWEESRVRQLVTLLAGRWVLSILAVLDDGPLRRRTLRAEIDGDVSDKVLTETLARLTTAGLVTRTLVPGVPPQVDYAVTDVALSLRPLLDTLDRWAATHLLAEGFSTDLD